MVTQSRLRAPLAGQKKFYGCTKNFLTRKTWGHFLGREAERVMRGARGSSRGASGAATPYAGGCSREQLHPEARARGAARLAPIAAKQGVDVEWCTPFASFDGGFERGPASGMVHPGGS